MFFTGAMQYLLNPDGKFATFYGKNFTAEQLAEGICKQVTDWKAGHPEYKGCRWQTLQLLSNYEVQTQSLLRRCVHSLPVIHAGLLA